MIHRHLPFFFSGIFICCSQLLSQPKPIVPQSQSIAPGISFRGMSAVSDKVCWVSGSKGNVWRTTNTGKDWLRIPTPAGDSLDYRDVQAFSKEEAWIMSAGEGAVSRVYHTTDAGKNWTLQLKMQEPKGFLDGFAFWDRDHAILLGDPVRDNVFDVYITEDGGTHWNRIPSVQLPQNKKDEYAFAASGTCVAVAGSASAWIVTGGGAARVFHTTDMGKSWTATETPMIHGKPSQGIFSVCFWDDKRGIIGGGDYEKPDTVLTSIYLTSNGGDTWFEMLTTQFLSCVTLASDNNAFVGSGYFCFGQLSWEEIGVEEGFHVASLSPQGLVIFAAGSNGRVTVIQPDASTLKRERKLKPQTKRSIR
jgi:photosystem II stability/assembly factor-like uncharacterized protein